MTSSNGRWRRSQYATRAARRPAVVAEFLDHPDEEGHRARPAAVGGGPRGRWTATATRPGPARPAVIAAGGLRRWRRRRWLRPPDGDRVHLPASSAERRVLMPCAVVPAVSTASRPRPPILTPDSVHRCSCRQALAWVAAPMATQRQRQAAKRNIKKAATAAKAKKSISAREDPDGARQAGRRWPPASAPAPTPRPDRSSTRWRRSGTYRAARRWAGRIGRALGER
jgi:hypothetical protein